MYIFPTCPVSADPYVFQLKEISLVLLLLGNFIGLSNWAWSKLSMEMLVIEKQVSFYIIYFITNKSCQNILIEKLSSEMLNFPLPSPPFSCQPRLWQSILWWLFPARFLTFDLIAQGNRIYVTVLCLYMLHARVSIHQYNFKATGSFPPDLI